MRSRSNKVSPAQIRVSAGIQSISTTRNGQSSTRSNNGNNQILMSNLAANSITNQQQQQQLQISNGYMSHNNSINNGMNGTFNANGQHIIAESRSQQNSPLNTPKKNGSHLGFKKLISGTVPVNYHQQGINSAMNGNNNNGINQSNTLNIQQNSVNNVNQNNSFQFGNYQNGDSLKSKSTSISKKQNSNSNNNINSNGQNNNFNPNNNLQPINSRPSTGRGQPKKDLQIQLGFDNMDLVTNGGNVSASNGQYENTSEGTNAILSAKNSNYSNSVTPTIINGSSNPNSNIVNNYINNRSLNKPYQSAHRRMTPNRLTGVDKIQLPTPQSSSRNSSPYWNSMSNNSARHRKQQQSLINKSYNGNKENNQYLEGQQIILTNQQQNANQLNLANGAQPSGQTQFMRLNNKSPINSARSSSYNNNNNNNSNNQVQNNGQNSSQQQSNQTQFERSNHSPLISKLVIIPNSTRSSSSNNNNRNKSGRSILKQRQIGIMNNNSFNGTEENPKASAESTRNSGDYNQNNVTNHISNGHNVNYFQNSQTVRQSHAKSTQKEKSSQNTSQNTNNEERLNMPLINPLQQIPNNQQQYNPLSQLNSKLNNLHSNEFLQNTQQLQQQQQQEFEQNPSGSNSQNNNNGNQNQNQQQPQNAANPEQPAQQNKGVFNMKYSFRTRKGFMPNNPNKVNQDTYIIHQNINKKPWQHFYSVCDGHGVFGHDVSGFLKRLLPLLFSEQSDRLEQDPRKVLNEIYEEANEKLNYESNIDILFSGSTVVSVYFHKNSIFCANIGDSRAILGKKNTQDKWSVIPLSRDHKPSDSDEAQRIIAENGRIEAFKDQEGKPIGPTRVWLKNENVPGLAMTRSMGDTVAESVGVTWRPEIIEYELSYNDKILVLASDGVWEFIDNKEIIKMIAPYYQRNDIEGACECLLQEAHLRWTRECNVIDDISFIIIFMNM
ncbi:hypothetical protein ABPG74_022074 [Tetrahymena malaccensis]